MSRELWEILVPTIRNDGRPFRLRYHRIWDEKVREIAGGLTVVPPVKGQWVFEEKLYLERNIPVRIACTKEQIVEIIKMTATYYDQIDVLAYKISDEVIFFSELK